ncbi:MAG: hypothetical protein AAGF24_14875, partial [Cyanobacteria bacterium P01_H01_bin.121]
AASTEGTQSQSGQRSSRSPTKRSGAQQLRRLITALGRGHRPPTAGLTLQGEGSNGNGKGGAGKKQRSAKPSEKGFEQGLKLWLFFLIGFFALGYGLPASILLGAAAGYSTGFIVANWQGKAKDEDVTQLTEPTDIGFHDTLQEQREQRYGRGRQRRPRYGRQSRFDWLLPWKR